MTSSSASAVGTYTCMIVSYSMYIVWNLAEIIWSFIGLYPTVQFWTKLDSTKSYIWCMLSLSKLIILHQFTTSSCVPVQCISANPMTAYLKWLNSCMSKPVCPTVFSVLSHSRSLLWWLFSCPFLFYQLPSPTFGFKREASSVLCLRHEGTGALSVSLPVAASLEARLKMTSYVLWKPGEFSMWVERGSAGWLKATTWRRWDLVSSAHQLGPWKPK